MMLRQCFSDGLNIVIVETEISMKTVQLAKDDASGNGGCPSVHMREDGMAVVQAPEVDADTFAGLPNVLPGERAVYIKPEVILEAADKIRQSRRG
jgi:hypothetical protein